MNNIHNTDLGFVAYPVKRPVVNPSSVVTKPGVSASDYINRLTGKGKGLSFNPQLHIHLGGGGNSGSNTKTSLKGSSRSNGNGSSGDGGGGRNGRDSRHGNNGRAGRFDQFPERGSTAKVSFSTDIRSDIIVNQRQLGSNEYSPCYILNGSLFPAINESKDGAKDSYFMDILNNDIFEKYLTVIFNRSSYSSKKDFNRSAFFDYTLTICNALEAFYCIDSILAYDEANHGRNYGLSILRDTLSADVQSEFSRLRDRLEFHCINPNIKMFISYMYQNFSFGETEDSAVIRLGFRRLLYPDPNDKSLSDNMKASYIREISDSLLLYSDIANTYARALPEHIIGELSPSCNGIMYDANFCNFWHNSNVCSADDVGTVNSRIASDFSSRLRYGTISSDPDGWTLALSSVVINDVSQPGLWKSNDLFEALDPESKSSLLALQNGRFIGCFDEEVASGSGIYSVPCRTDYTMGLLTKSFVIPGSKIVQSYDTEHSTTKAYPFIRLLFDISNVSLKSR